MDKREDGGPAFPRPASTDQHDVPCNIYQDQHGMSLRDWFAGQALAGLIAGDWCDRTEAADGMALEEATAAQAYQIADALLAARTKAEGGEHG